VKFRITRLVFPALFRLLVMLVASLALAQKAICRSFDEPLSLRGQR